MLDKSSIAQLSQLKQDILSSKDVADGTVLGSNGKYGFVKLSDGRTAFLNPEKMQRVFPGDLITVDVAKNAKDQLEAEFEAFLSSPLTRFVGRYKIKGNAHFVVPADKSINRWIFLPPQNRIKCKEDDFVLAEVTRHPYADGKAAAKIITHVGSAGDNFLHHSMITAKYGLARYWSRDALKQAEECAEACKTFADFNAEDLTHLSFVTIDSASTKDMDDALYVEANPEGGWTAWAAIAAPAYFFNPGSFIAKSARYFGQTVYLPGRALPMLPEGLATGAFSLKEGELRPALVCKIEFTQEGEIKNYTFSEAKITSKHKLSYQDVGAFLDGDDTALRGCDEATKTGLKLLHQVAQVRYDYRVKHNIVFDDQPDYDWQLNKQGFIDSIKRRNRSSAHRAVEEAMIATNTCAGEFLAGHNTGIFSSQIGFRPERIGEVRALLREEFGDDFDPENIDTFDGYIGLIHTIKNSTTHKHLLAPLRRLMHSTELTSNQQPHMGMGLKHYAPITSPIRRYADICNHWSIKQLLKQSKPQALPNRLIEQLVVTLDNARKANRELEQILMCDYLKRHMGDAGDAVIRIVTQQGFGVRLLDTGMEGFIQIPKGCKKVFDAKRMTLSVGEHTFALDGIVKAKVVSVDEEKRRVKMELSEIVLAPKKEAKKVAEATAEKQPASADTPRPETL